MKQKQMHSETSAGYTHIVLLVLNMSTATEGSVIAKGQQQTLS